MAVSKGDQVKSTVFWFCYPRNCSMFSGNSLGINYGRITDTNSNRQMMAVVDFIQIHKPESLLFVTYDIIVRTSDVQL